LLITATAIAATAIAATANPDSNRQALPVIISVNAAGNNNNAEIQEP